jgi:hypothetical protein
MVPFSLSVSFVGLAPPRFDLRQDSLGPRERATRKRLLERAERAPSIAEPVVGDRLELAQRIGGTRLDRDPALDRGRDSGWVALSGVDFRELPVASHHQGVAFDRGLGE